MSFLHAHSCEGVKSESLLFQVPPTQTSLESARYVHYQPISSITPQGPLEFCVTASDDYLDLSHTLLYVCVTITHNATEEELGKPNVKNKMGFVGPTNNFLHSLISQIDVTLNNKLVSTSSGAYAYRAYIETLLNYGPAAKESHLTTVLWCSDTAGQMDDCEEANVGLTTRRRLFNSKSIDMICRLHCDVFSQPRLILPNVEMKVKLIRTPDSFSLMDPTGIFYVRIDSASLMVRRVKLSPSTQLSHARSLAQTPAKYPLTNVQVKTVTLQSGITGTTVDNLIMGTVPKRIVLGFVDNKAYNGDKILNHHHH